MIEIKSLSYTLLVTSLICGFHSPAWAWKPLTPDEAEFQMMDSEQIITLPERYTNAWGMEFVLIRPGTFLMGSPDGDPNMYPSYSPHWVRIAQPFYLQTHEMTQGQWEQVMKDTDYPNVQTLMKRVFRFIEGEDQIQSVRLLEVGPNYPMYYVSWYDVQNFITKMKDSPYLRYRLPSVAEREYAARAGSMGRYWWGNDVKQLKKYANVRGDDFHYKPVGSYPPNPWGLYDMIGNVGEGEHNQYYQSYPPANSPQAAVRDPLEAVKIPGFTHEYSGFRLAIEADSVATKLQMDALKGSNFDLSQDDGS